MRRPAALALLLGLLAFDLWFVRINLANLARGHPGDFLSLWSFGRWVWDKPFAGIYHPAALHGFQLSLGAPATIHAPYPYPPLFALIMAPFALLPVRAAFWAFSAVGLAAFLAACLAGRFAWRDLLWLMALPAVPICLVGGQNGLLSGAFMVAGLRLLPRRPLLAGLAFGLLAFKPQLGLLVPVALLAARQWRAIAAAMLAVLAQIVIAGLAFGWRVWPIFLHSLGGHFAAYGGAISIDHLMPTVSAGMLQMGAGPGIAHAVQLLAAIAAAWVVWRVFSRGCGQVQGAALIAASFLATPYAFIYDMPMLSMAILWGARAPNLRRAEIILLGLAALMPLLLPLSGQPMPVGALSLAGLLVVTARHS